MEFKIKPLLLKSDFIGFVPQFRIIDESRYKSIFSSLLSIIIILFAIAFVSYSFMDYVHQIPKVEYYKNNDYETNKTFTISNSLFMFNYFFYCITNDSKKPTLQLHSHEVGYDIYEYEKIEFEPCELGKNIDLKYKDAIERYNSTEIDKINEYFCLNFTDKEFTLYNNPNLPSEYERYFSLQVDTDCENYYIIFNLITENDFIDHNKKDNPFIPHYKKNEFVLMDEKKINLIYNYQYIKYESDNGFIFPDKKITNGIGSSISNSFNTKNVDYESIIYLEFKLNSANYDYYKRTFTKFQSFLAESVSLINLLITISKIISEFLLYKKMHKDIIRYIMTSEKIKNNNRIIIKIPREKQFNKIIEMNYNTEKSNSKQIIEENNNIEMSKNNDDLNTSNKQNDSDIEKADEKIIKVMKNLKLYNIIKSFFCCKDNKLILINLCNNIVEKDICVERILKRLYLIENEFNILMNEEFYQIYNIIDSIKNETNEKKINLKKTVNKNNEIK